MSWYESFWINIAVRWTEWQARRSFVVGDSLMDRIRQRWGR